MPKGKGQNKGYTACQSCGQGWCWNYRLSKSSYCNKCGALFVERPDAGKPGQPKEVLLESAWVAKARVQHKAAVEAGDVKTQKSLESIFPVLVPKVQQQTPYQRINDAHAELLSARKAAQVAFD